MGGAASSLCARLLQKCFDFSCDRQLEPFPKVVSANFKPKVTFSLSSRSSSHGRGQRICAAHARSCACPRDGATRSQQKERKPLWLWWETSGCSSSSAYAGRSSDVSPRRCASPHITALADPPPLASLLPRVWHRIARTTSSTQQSDLKSFWPIKIFGNIS